jgi:hypothetical protein
MLERRGFNITILEVLHNMVRHNLALDISLLQVALRAAFTHIHDNQECT